MSLVLMGSSSGSVTLQEPAVAGSTVLDLPATSGTVGLTTSQIGFKNRIINGAMVIDQRYNGASNALSAGDAYFLDRWNAQEDTAGGVSVQRDTVAPPGFVNSMKFTVTSASGALSATQNCLLRQIIEGSNVADFAWGTANAQTVTLSFWVRSSVTGTFGGSFLNSALTRAYPYTYVINSANTWEYKTITVPGDTTGTWLTDNGRGILVYFSLGAGSTYSGTAGAWTNGLILTATGATNLVATNGATFYLTGVQLELGSAATTFDFRSIGTELALCQRYAWYAPANLLAVGGLQSSTATQVCGFFPVQMRVPPTTVTYSTNMTVDDFYSTTVTGTGYGGAQVSDISFRIHVTGHASLTPPRPMEVSPNNSARVFFLSEL